MKRYIVFILALFYVLTAHSQVIKGIVRDQKTKEPIYSASVYFNGTFGGTLTDQNGKFELEVKKYGKMPMTVSALGYYSVSVTDFLSHNPVEVYLAPKLFELEEVVVKAKSHAWERKENLEIFRREFLGTTSNSFNCKIINEDDLKFIYKSAKDTIKAYALKPLIIDNKALGFKVTYYLDKFEYCKMSGSFSFNGNAIFSEDTTLTDERKTYFERKRMDTYLGSRMQFFRALWADDLNSAGFTVKNSANETLKSKLIVYSDGRSKYLRYLGSDMGIAYYSKQPTSFIIFSKDKVYFDGNGYFEPSALIWEGEMAKKRIADLLPFEYLPLEK